MAHPQGMAGAGGAGADGANAAPLPPRAGRTARRSSQRGLWLLLGCLAAAGIAYALAGPAQMPPFLRPARLWSGLGWPLSKTLAFLSGGLLLGQLLEATGWTARLGVLAWPLIRLAHLPKQAGAAFSAAFASGVAANTLLYTSWQEGALDKRQLMLANILCASLPAFFLHLPTTFFVVYALLGRAALWYFGLTLLAAILRTLAVVLISRAWLPAQAPGQAAPLAARPTWAALWADTWRKFGQRLRRMLLIVLPVYLMVFLLAGAGFFAWLSHAAAGAVTGLALPVEAMSVVVFAVVAEFTLGFAAAGALMQSGSLVLKQVVLALLIGNLVATPVRALRHQLPHYLGIYSPGLGARLLALGQGARVVSVALVAVVYAWLG
ncbi:MAG: hypothetical protein V1797_04395 [Pseudomonadota bacterium]